MGLKQMEAREVTVGNRKCFITPFGAFKAANMSGELANVLAPLIGAFAPLVGSGGSLSDIDVSRASEAIANCNAISGDKLELLMKKLLLGGHIGIEVENDNGETETVLLDRDYADEIFCGDVQDMFILCFEVIKINFDGFFKRFTTPSGKAGVVESPKKKRTII